MFVIILVLVRNCYILRYFYENFRVINDVLNRGVFWGFEWGGDRFVCIIFFGGLKICLLRNLCKIFI